jgi:hypothetical protein
MTKSFVAVAVAAALGSVGVAAHAGASPHHRARVSHASAGPRSYVDVDDNGRFSAVDQKLPAPIAPGVEYANLTTLPGKLGAVIGGGLPQAVIVVANGDIHVTGSLGGDMLQLSTLEGDIWIDANVHLNANKYGVVLSAPNGTIHIGDNASVNAGSGSPVQIKGRAEAIGNNVRVSADSVFGSVGIIGAATFGTGDAFVTPTGGESQDTRVAIETCGNIDLDQATIAAEDITINATSSCTEGGGHVSITNSHLKLDVDGNAMLDIQGSPVNLEGTTITPANVARM